MKRPLTVVDAPNRLLKINPWGLIRGLLHEVKFTKGVPFIVKSMLQIVQRIKQHHVDFESYCFTVIVEGHSGVDSHCATCQCYKGCYSQNGIMNWVIPKSELQPAPTIAWPLIKIYRISIISYIYLDFKALRISSRYAWTGSIFLAFSNEFCIMLWLYNYTYAYSKSLNKMTSSTRRATILLSPADRKFAYFGRFSGTGVIIIRFSHYLKFLEAAWKHIIFTPTALPQPHFVVFSPAVDPNTVALPFICSSYHNQNFSGAGPTKATFSQR